MEQIGYVYILECANEKYYTGSTIDLDKRLEEHNAGLGANFTRKYLPFNLVYVEVCETVDRAFQRKNKFKDGVTKRSKH